LPLPRLNCYAICHRENTKIFGLPLSSIFRLAIPLKPFFDWPITGENNAYKAHIVLAQHILLYAWGDKKSLFVH
jgi:hypothetical protein